MRWIYILGFGGIGLFLVWGGVTGILNTLALQKRGIRAMGVVVDSARSSARQAKYHPIVEFIAVDGKAHRVGVSASSFKTGDTLEVMYLSDNPNIASAYTTDPSISGSVAAAVIGLMFLAPLLVLVGPFALTAEAARAAHPEMTPMQANAEAMFSRFVPAVKWFAVLVVGGTGLAVFVSGAFIGVSRALLLSSGIHAEGTIVDYVTTSKGAVPVVEFIAEDGQKHRFVSETFGDYGVGAKRDVIYDKSKPANAVLSAFQQYWLPVIVLLGFGAFFLGFGALVYRFLIIAE